ICTNQATPPEPGNPGSKSAPDQLGSAGETVVARSSREKGSTLLRWGRHGAPVLVSVGLVAWLVWTVTPGKLLNATSTSVWPWLVLATLVQLLVMFLWDTVSLWWLLSLPDQPVSFPMVLRKRIDASLWTAVNVQLGQGMFAWNVARSARLSQADALGRLGV